VGDFYEFFGDDAVRLAKYMDLTLTGRDCGLEERVPMVGIPYHASESYFMKIATKYKLAIVDNDEVSVMEMEETVFVNETITEEERHDLFDDDLDENEPTVYENNDEEDEFEEERALQKFFDKDALCALYELFDFNLDMQ
jgi:DNA mismatch repair ATPase MutS